MPSGRPSHCGVRAEHVRRAEIHERLVEIEHVALRQHGPGMVHRCFRIAWLPIAPVPTNTRNSTRATLVSRMAARLPKAKLLTAPAVYAPMPLNESSVSSSSGSRPPKRSHRVTRDRVEAPRADVVAERIPGAHDVVFRRVGEDLERRIARRATRDISAARDRPASAAASLPTRGCGTDRGCAARVDRVRGGGTRRAVVAETSGGRRHPAPAVAESCVARCHNRATRATVSFRRLSPMDDSSSAAHLHPDGRRRARPVCSTARGCRRPTRAWTRTATSTNCRRGSGWRAPGWRRPTSGR